MGRSEIKFRLRRELIAIILFKIVLLFFIREIWFSARPAWHQAPDTISAHLLTPRTSFSSAQEHSP